MAARDPDAAGPFSGRVSFDDVDARAEAADLGDEPATMRERFATLVLGDAADEQSGTGAPEEVGGVGGLVFRPGGAASGTARVVWFHGGGYAFGSPETHARAAAALAERVGAAVFVPRYRLAPEHPWPAQREDALAVVRALQDAGGRVALVGDSAGGHLALVAALALARGDRPVDALVLFSPNTDRTGRSDTRGPNTPRDAMNADEDDRDLARLAFGDRPDSDPEVSPLLDDLSLLPPTHVEVGDQEVLLDDARLLARRGAEAGADVALHVEPGASHMWQLWTPWLPEADASIGRAAAFLRQRLGAGADG